MADVMVMIRVPEKLSELMDDAIRKYGYQNRSEFTRSAISAFILDLDRGEMDLKDND